MIKDIYALAMITPEIVEFIKPWGLNGICEIGSGDGAWIDMLKAEGILTIGYDVKTGINSSVLQGDHNLAARSHSDMALLIVWPPDGNTVQNWINAWKGDIIILCANHLRAEIGFSLSGFVKKATFQKTITGRKGSSTLLVYSRLRFEESCL